MVAYRFYCLDGAGTIGQAEWIDAEDDDDAVRKARRLKNGALKCEIWSKSRLVATLSANDLAS